MDETTGRRLRTDVFGKPDEVTTCHYAGLYNELHAAISSKESLDPDKLEGVKILLSGMLDGFSVLAEDLNRRKE